VHRLAALGCQAASDKREENSILLNLHEHQRGAMSICDASASIHPNINN
jgi:hypothetical protein